MPTLALGRTETRERGFTLVETLVVLLIIGMITAAASLSTWNSRSDSMLHDDARRLAHLLSLAQNEARAWGIAIEWRYDAHGYWFEPIALAQANHGARLSPVPAPSTSFVNGSLRRRDWHDPERLRIDIEPRTGNLLTADWRSGPARITLSDGMNVLQVQRAASGLYEVIR